MLNFFLCEFSQVDLVSYVKRHKASDGLDNFAQLRYWIPLENPANSGQAEKCHLI